MFMKKLISLFVLFLLISCTPIVSIYDSPDKGDKMFRTMNGLYSIEQFDSMCISDTIPNSFSEWVESGFKDYETGEKIRLYLYMKENGKTEYVYRVEVLKNDSVKITKRVITE